ncbi:MAG: hypothetical protein V1742_10310 [Pseudomonadota bacterium]
MTLKKKILIGYGVAFVLMGLVVAWAVVNLVSLGQASNAILRKNYRSILAAENMVDTLERQDSGILLLFLGDAERGISQFRDNEAVFLQWLARAKDNITVRGEAELVRSIEVDYAGYRQRFSELTDLSGAEKPRLTLHRNIYQESVYPLFIKVREACIRLRHLNEETMYAGQCPGRSNRPAGHLVHGGCGGLGFDHRADLQPVSLRAHRPAAAALHGGVPPDRLGRLRRPGSG